MKKILSMVAATALIATSSFALDTSKLYGGASLAIETLSSDVDSGVALILNGGLPVMEAGKAGPGTVGVEGEFTYSIVSPSYEILDSTGSWPNTSVSTKSIDLTVMTLGAYGVYTYDINKQFFVKPRVGLIYRSVDVDGGGSDSEMGLAMGVQGGYKLDEKMDVIFGYNMLDGSDLTHLSAGIQIRF